MSSTTEPGIAIVPAGRDLFNERRQVGANTIEFKLVPEESRDLLIAEITCYERGGPALHLHHDQDEFFYIVEGEFVIQVGGQRLTPKPGDALLGPREVPHTWARVGDARGRFLFALAPHAARMVSFFHEISELGSRPGQDPETWRRHGMEVVGPPLFVE